MVSDNLAASPEHGAPKHGHALLAGLVRCRRCVASSSFAIPRPTTASRPIPATAAIWTMASRVTLPLAAFVWMTPSRRRRLRSCPPLGTSRSVAASLGCLRVKCDTSRAATAPTSPRQTSATIRLNPSPSALPEAERPRSSSMTSIRDYLSWPNRSRMGIAAHGFPGYAPLDGRMIGVHIRLLCVPDDGVRSSQTSSPASSGRGPAGTGLHDVPIQDCWHSHASRALALGESLPMMIGKLLGHRKCRPRIGPLDGEPLEKMGINRCSGCALLVVQC